MEVTTQATKPVSELKDDEIVIALRDYGNKVHFVTMDDRSDPMLQTEKWRIRATETLCRGLRSPELPCAYMILGCIGSLGMTLVTSSERTDSVWDACVYFLSRPRTRGETRVAVSTPCPCSDEVSSGRLHRAGQTRFAPLRNRVMPPFAWAVVELFRILGMATTLCREPKFKLWKTERRLREAHQDGSNGRLPWPQHWQQLFPHGIEDSFHGIAAWIGQINHRTFHVALLKAVTGYLMQCHGVVLPFLVNSSQTVEAIVRVVNSEIGAWNTKHVDADYRLADASIHMGRMVTFLDCLGKVSLAERLVLLRISPGKLLLACDRAMTVCEEQRAEVRRIDPDKSSDKSGEFKEHWSRFFLIALDILLWIPELPERRQLQNLKRLEQGVALERECMTATPLGQLEDALKSLEYQQHCAAPGCLQAFLHQAARFRYCASCLRVPYCSVRCAKRAWNDSDLPHSAVWSDIRIVCGRLGITRTHVEERFTELKDTRRFIPVQPEGPRIVEYFRELRSRRMSVRSDQQWEANLKAGRNKPEIKATEAREADLAADKERLIQESLAGLRSITEIPDSIRERNPDMTVDQFRHDMVTMKETMLRVMFGMKDPMSPLARV